MPCSSKGQSQRGQRGGSSYTSTVRSQYGQSASRIAGCSVSFGIGIHSGGAVHPCIGRIPRTLNQADGRTPGGTLLRAVPHPDAKRPSRLGGSRCSRVPGSVGRPVDLGGLHLLAASALASRDVGVDRFVLPAEVPLVVDRKLGRAPRGRADAITLVSLVGPRERPDRLAPETLLRHLVHVPSSLSPEDGSGVRPRRVIRTM
jgi:hypothetical protein